MEIWNTLLFQPLVSILVVFLKTFGSLGAAIIILTLLLRAVLIPLTIPSMKAQKKMAELAPEIAKLKKKHAGDKEKLAKAQMELYKQAGANPAAGCLPMIVQFVILIALYQAFVQVLRPDGAAMVAKINEIVYPFLRLPQEAKIDLSFLYLNLAKPDTIHLSGLPPLPGLFLILASLAQLLSGKMMAPIRKVVEKEAKKTPEKSDDMMASMQSQMLYLFPVMTIFIGYSFPSGLVLYWFVFSAFQLIQQYFMFGWGGLTPWLEKIGISDKMKAS
ncbi:MAG: YidC/Oxa1 family membrane protein insertase [bacterium]|nr:YidC/Oxa1 family membrane protein insertase [bacterium]